MKRKQSKPLINIAERAQGLVSSKDRSLSSVRSDYEAWLKTPIPDVRGQIGLFSGEAVIDRAAAGSRQMAFTFEGARPTREARARAAKAKQWFEEVARLGFRYGSKWASDNCRKLDDQFEMGDGDMVNALFMHFIKTDAAFRETLVGCRETWRYLSPEQKKAIGLEPCPICGVETTVLFCTRACAAQFNDLPVETQIELHRPGATLVSLRAKGGAA